MADNDKKGDGDEPMAYRHDNDHGFSSPDEIDPQPGDLGPTDRPPPPSEGAWVWWPDHGGAWLPDEETDGEPA